MEWKKLDEVPWVEMAAAKAADYEIPSLLLLLLIAKESGEPGAVGSGDPLAVKNDRIGLMRIRIQVAERILSEAPSIVLRILMIPEVSLIIGTHYLAQKCREAARIMGLEDAEGLKGMLAAYQLGPERFLKKLSDAVLIDPDGKLEMETVDVFLPEETREYWRSIWSDFEKRQAGEIIQEK